MTAPLFSEVTFRGLTLKNRIVVSPMCQYSCTDGLANDWTFQHLAARAVGGAALVFTEATAVTPEGRISPADLGLWSDDHVEPLRRCTDFIHSHNAAAGIQLAHAGRKGSTAPPWEGGRLVSADQGGWPTMAPSALPFHDDDPPPHALTTHEIRSVVDAFADAARRGCDAGFDVVELHFAHGYLVHEFLSPLCNHRDDEYGGTFDNRTRIAREITEAVRAAIPETMPLSVRLSVTDWADGGWDEDQSVALAGALGTMGADLIDCSSGGAVPNVKIPVAPGYQVPFARRIRRECDVATGAVGLITEAAQANDVIVDGSADVVLLGRELLRHPYWPLHAARALQVDVAWPVQYRRAKRW